MMRKGALATLARYFPTTSFDKLINVTPSSTLSGRGDAFLVFDPRHDFKDYCWISENKENSSITIQFMRDKLSLSSYSVKMRTDFSYNYPLEWNLEGSNNGNEWELVHHKERNKDLSSPDKVGTFICNNSKLFSFFKLTQIGANDYKREEEMYHFALKKVEFYGKFEFPLASFTCYYMKSTSSRCVAMLILLLS